MRTFTDETGTEWRVWAIDPGQLLRAARAELASEHRTGGERRSSMAREPIIERRRDASRRTEAPRAMRSVARGLLGGWLTFESDSRRRRLAPVPPGWAAMSHAELVALWRRATPAPPSGFAR